MPDQNNADIGDTDDQNQAQVNVNDHEKNEHMIPKTRFDQINEKRKAAETALEEIATTLIEDVPEEMRDNVPDLRSAGRRQPKADLKQVGGRPAA